MGGICDERQHLCFALALWNGRDPILKERLFGLSGKCFRTSFSMFDMPWSDTTRTVPGGTLAR